MCLPGLTSFGTTRAKNTIHATLPVEVLASILSLGRHVQRSLQRVFVNLYLKDVKKSFWCEKEGPNEARRTN